MSGDKKELIRKLVAAGIGLIVGILVGFAIFTGAVTKSWNKNKDSMNNLSKVEGEVKTEENSEEEFNHTTFDYEHEVLEGEKLDEAVNNLQTIFTLLSEGNPYFEVQVSDSESDIYMYNKEGECFAQSADGSYTVVYKTDGEAVKYGSADGSVTIGKDLDILGVIKNVVKIAKERVEGVQFLEMDMVDEPTPDEDGHTPVNYHEYRISVKGEEAVKKIYEPLGKDFAEDMVNMLKESIQGETDKEWEPHLIYCYLISDNENITTYCYVVHEGKEYLNWASEGYLDLSDWKLSKEWYEYDFNTEEMSSIEDLYKGLVDDIAQVLEKYAKENGLEPILEEVAESETTEAETEATGAETSTSTSETEAKTSEVETEATEAETEVTEVETSEEEAKVE